MLVRHFWLSCLAAASYAQSSSAASSASTTSGSSLDTLSSTLVTSVTGSYQQFSVQSTVSQTDATDTASSSSSGTGTATTTSASKGTTSIATLLLGGGIGLETLSIINGTTTIYPNSTASGSKSSTKTSTSATATNTQACNNYPEFCDRKYSNITEVCAHNSAFDITGNAFSNQKYDITAQLNDGIRMIQGETHYVNDTIYSCHTSCTFLNAGTYQSELETVAAWVKANPYDVVTLLIVNSDYVEVGNYTAPLQNSGLGPYLYEPPYIPMRLDDWPTLSELILTQKRVIVFMDYNANQTQVPYILDEFTHMWETPFSPQDVDFPCTIQRPPTLTNDTEARDEFMYLANHNLNQAITFSGDALLLPNTAVINNTNAAGNETGMLGLTADTCSSDWGRSPNFLLVDYYNIGNGSVFDVAAKHNGVTYNRKCCGYDTTVSGAASLGRSSILALVVALTVSLTFLV